MTAVVVTSPHRAPNDHLDAASDADLLVLVREGDARAFAALYARYEGEARRFARRLVGPDDIDDLVSESFAKVLHALRNGKGPIDNPDRYLMVAVRTTAATIHARRARQEVVSDRLADLPVEEPEVDLGDDQLQRAFGSLAPRWRQVIWWTEVEGLRAAEIGRKLGISADAASALSYRARRALREAYGSAAAPAHDA